MDHLDATINLDEYRQKTTKHNEAQRPWWVKEIGAEAERLKARASELSDYDQAGIEITAAEQELIKIVRLFEKIPEQSREVAGPMVRDLVSNLAAI